MDLLHFLTENNFILFFFIPILVILKKTLYILGFIYYIKGNQRRKGSIYPSAYSNEAYEGEIEQVVFKL